MIQEIFLFSFIFGFVIIVVFFIPFALFLFLYLQSVYLLVYQKWNNLSDSDLSGKGWNTARKMIANLWLLHGSLWHGYEIIGIDNVPKNKPAILILFHGTVPVDFYYFVTLMSLDPDRKISVIGDKFLFKIPGLALLMRLFNVNSGTLDSCVADLRAGKILILSPGGAREAVFSDNRYTLLWNQRSGFAKIALQEHIPIIPVFTQNIREGYRVATFGLQVFRNFYEKHRLPLIPIYGGFPVKLKTIIGEPIYPKVETTNSYLLRDNTDLTFNYGNRQNSCSPHAGQAAPNVKAFAQQCHDSLTSLIHKHQRLPGKIILALLQRITDNPFTYITVNKFFKEKKNI